MKKELTASKIRIKENKFQKLTLGAIHSQIVKFKQKKKAKKCSEKVVSKDNSKSVIMFLMLVVGYMLKKMVSNP